MYKLEANPLTISGILKQGWELYKCSFIHVVIWSLILSIVHILPYIHGFIGFFYRMNGHFAFSWWGLLIYLALLVAESFFVAVLFYSMYSIATEQKVNYPKAIAVASSQFMNMYIGNLVYYLAVTMAMFLFILPSVFIAILFSMFIPFIVIEKQPAYQSFDSSVRLVWGHWWQTFFVFIVPYAIAFAARSFLKFTPWGEWRFVVDLVVYTVVMPFFYASLLIQFNNLKVIRSLPEPISTRPRSEHPS